MANPFSRIVWPSTSGAYRFNISNFRQAMNEVYDWLRKSQGVAAKTEVAEHIKVFATKAGINVDSATPSTQVRINSGVKVTAPAITGSYVNGYTFTIVGGVITAIVAS